MNKVFKWRIMRAVKLPLMASLLVGVLAGCSTDIDHVWEEARRGNPAPLMRAAENEDPEAQRILAALYVRGESVPQDYAEALRWMRLSASQGEVDAQLSLASWHAKGELVEKDNVEAIKWYRFAAEQGRPYAQHLLGMTYAGMCNSSGGREIDEFGKLICDDSLFQAVPPDYVQAHMWLNLAASGAASDELSAEGGSEAAGAATAAAYTRDRDSVERLMTTEQVTEAQHRALEWRRKDWESLKPSDL